MVELQQRPIRQIKSFVRRQGRMTQSQIKAMESWWPLYGVTLGDEPVDLNELFRKEKPVIMEIGFGMGGSLAAMAHKDAERNYLGVEVHLPGVGNLLKLLHENGLENVRLVNDDANRLLDLLPDDCLSGLLLFFPDPWPKKRHHKRRIVQPEWIERIAQKLKPGGFIHMATDWEPYALWMQEVMEASPLFVNRAGDGGFHPRPDYRPMTKFEQRGKRLGHGVWDLIYDYRT